MLCDKSWVDRLVEHLCGQQLSGTKIDNSYPENSLVIALKDAAVGETTGDIVVIYNNGRVLTRTSNQLSSRAIGSPRGEAKYWLLLWLLLLWSSRGRSLIAKAAIRFTLGNK